MAPPTRRLWSGFPHLTSVAWKLRDSLNAKVPGLTLLLAPDNATALNLRDDLSFLDPGLEVFFLPALETDLLRNRSPSLQRRMDRIRAIHHLASPSLERSSLLIASAEAYTQYLPDFRRFSDRTLRLEIGQSLSKTDLFENLVRIGYVPESLVEREGQVASRGSILDVFSPLYEFPARIELFDDEIQSLRLFHPDSQRRVDDLKSLTIPPAREFLWPESEADLSKFRSELRKQVDEWDWERENRDAILERISQRSLFPTIDYWAEMISAEGERSFQLPVPDFVLEPMAVETEYLRARSQSERWLEESALEGEWVPKPDRFLRPAAESRTDLNRALLSSPTWLTSRATTGLESEPTQSETTSIASLDVFASRLAAERGSRSEEPLRILADEIGAWSHEGIRAFFVAPTVSQIERLQFLLSAYEIRFRIFESVESALESTDPIVGLVGTLNDGFIDRELGVAFLLDEQILGSKRKKTPTRSQRSFTGDVSLMDLKINDLVVHKEHGIGRYLGLKIVDFGGFPSELVEIEYRDGSKLLVPVTRLNTLQKFSGAQESGLDKLGGATWETKKSKVKRELVSLAGELLHLYSLRELARGPELHPGSAEVERFAATFPYAETDDQAKSIEFVLKDLQGPKPMDRLVCGDVGYGKTEVAIRAAHAAVASGFQVAILVPTTILAAQHETTFRRRLEPFGFRVAGLSRFKTTKENRDAIGGIREGTVHVAVGTHKLLGQEVAFKKLGLVVIDEEQKFGVSHKEKLKRLKTDVHVLSMTATPIPRTLNMAMSGIKDISLISTPPTDRLSVRTHVSRKKEGLIQEAIEAEIARGGQVFYVHNRVQTIQRELELLKRLAPKIAIGFVHGQMNEDEIESRMVEFYEGKIQVLLATSIIESGLDVPNANTLIVDRADTFGLSQLYQMRGRVGRSNQRAHAYFLVPEQGTISNDAEERLSVLETYQELGSGFHIASHDLEIRGAGDLLGRSQSGQIGAIGYDAYIELLQECLADLKGEPVETPIDPEVKLGIDSTIPVHYVPEIGLRLNFYRRLAGAENEDEVGKLEAEMADRFGPPPESVKNLAASMRVKCQLRRLRIRSLSASAIGFSVTFDPSTPISTTKLIESIKRYPAHFQLIPDGRLLLKRPQASDKSQLHITQSIEGALALLESWVE